MLNTPESPADGTGEDAAGVTVAFDLLVLRAVIATAQLAAASTAVTLRDIRLLDNSRSF